MSECKRDAERDRERDTERERASSATEEVYNSGRTLKSEKGK